MAIDPITAVSVATALAPLAKDFGGTVGTGVRNILPESWGRWRDALGAGAASLGGGPLGLSGYRDALKQQKQQEQADSVISSYLNGGHNRYLTPAHTQQAQNWALQGGGNFGGDPGMKGLARQWAGGQGGVDFNTQLGQQMLQGGVDPGTMAMLNRQIGGQFDQLRNQQGASQARAGLGQSSIGQRMMGDTYNAERNAMSDAVAGQSLARQNLGLGILSQADASMFARQNLGANEFARQQGFDLAGRNLDMNYRQMGFNVLSGAENRDMARQQFGINLQLGRLDRSEARRDATQQNSAEVLGGLYSEHMEGQRRTADRAAFEKHSTGMQDAMKNITPARTNFPSYNPPDAQIQRPSFSQAKASNMAGGSGVKSPFMGGVPKGMEGTLGGRKSILQRRTGAGGVRSNPSSSR